MDQEGLKAELKRLFREGGILLDEEIHPRYWKDGLRAHRALPSYPKEGYRPLAVVRVESTQQVVELVKIARRHKVGLVPYGGGTGLMGGALAKDAILLDLRGLDRIQIEPEDLVAIVGAGVVLEELEKRLNAKGLRLGHDPWSRPRATVGGSIATNALGYLGSSFGSMGDQVLGLEAVLGDGRVIRTRAAEYSSTGPRLHQLLIGSEGTLGIITEAILRIYPLPERTGYLGLNFPSFREGFEFVKRVTLLGIEACLDLGCEAYRSGRSENERLKEGEACVYAILEGLEGEVELKLSRLSSVAKELGGEELGDEEARDFWERRHETIYRYDIDAQGRSKVDERWRGRRFDFIHVYLPISRVLEYKARCHELLDSKGADWVEYGLWHRPELFSVIFSMPKDDEASTKAMMECLDKMLRWAHQLGGSMEYCHGIGLKLAHLAREELGGVMEVLRAMKGILDPDGILNPGKLGL